MEVLKLLDRKIASNGYNFSIKATDNGLPARSSYKEVHVRLGDMNDHRPVICFCILSRPWSTRHLPG